MEGQAGKSDWESDPSRRTPVFVDTCGGVRDFGVSGSAAGDRWSRPTGQTLLVVSVSLSFVSCSPSRGRGIRDHRTLGLTRHTRVCEDCDRGTLGWVQAHL